jgi:hypothetical protein
MIFTNLCPRTSYLIKIIGKCGARMILEAGINFSKLGQVATFLFLWFKYIINDMLYIELGGSNTL